MGCPSGHHPRKKRRVGVLLKSRKARLQITKTTIRIKRISPTFTIGNTLIAALINICQTEHTVFQVSSQEIDALSNVTRILSRIILKRILPRRHARLTIVIIQFTTLRIAKCLPYTFFFSLSRNSLVDWKRRRRRRER